MRPRSIVVAVLFTMWGVIAGAAGADDRTPPTPGNATISCGEWRTDFDPPLDRIATPVPAMGAGNNHQLLPNVVTIQQGGAVNFAVSGLHNPTVYDDGTKPETIDVSTTLPGAAGGIIDDPTGRIFRGIDPNLATTPRDRIEVIHFPKPGTYLVICGVANHFSQDHMFGFVKVIPAR